MHNATSPLGLIPILFLAGCAAAVETSNTEPRAEPGAGKLQSLAEPESDFKVRAASWKTLAANGAPQGREDHTAVWTGTEMIVWGGEITGEGATPLNTGARYNPDTDSWRSMSQVGAPERRDDHAVVWTGTEMLVWGGNQTDESSELLASGGRYDPATDRWRAMSSGPLSPRDDPTAVWTGEEMIVWGGCTLWRRHEGSGARYDPASDRWTMVSYAGAPHAREDHTAVWTGEEMIVWGGWSGHDRARRHYNDGGRYNPRTNAWTPLSTKGAPDRREDHTAVWTGTEMLVWGGVIHRYDRAERAVERPVESAAEGPVAAADEALAEDDDDEAPVEAAEAPLPRRAKIRARRPATKRAKLVQLGTGALYNPVTDTWRPITTTDAPKRREDHIAVWTGRELLVWGGRKGKKLLADGALYDPTTDRWRPISMTRGEPAPRWNHTAVFASNQVIIWGGYADGYDVGGARYLP